MLAKRIIPCLDVKEGRVVKGINFVNLRDAGDPVEQAAVYDREGADELTFLDITASYEKRNTMLDMVRRVADAIFIPFCVGNSLAKPRRGRRPALRRKPRQRPWLSLGTGWRTCMRNMRSSKISRCSTSACTFCATAAKPSSPCATMR